MSVFPYLVVSKYTRHHFFEHVAGVAFMSEHFCWSAKLERPPSGRQNTLRGGAIIAMVEVDDRAAILCHRKKHVIWVEPTVGLGSGVNLDNRITEHHISSCGVRDSCCSGGGAVLTPM
jgi:hypothetical protein